MVKKSPHEELRDSLFSEFVKMGLDHVRLQYGGTPPSGASVNLKTRYSFAKEWLSKFDEEERLSNIKERDEAKRVARSAEKAAWAAAIAAIIAAIAAVVAIAMSP